MMNQNRNQNEGSKENREAAEAFQRLKEGNSRFVSGEAQDLAQRRGAKR